MLALLAQAYYAQGFDLLDCLGHAAELVLAAGGTVTVGMPAVGAGSTCVALDAHQFTPVASPTDLATSRPIRLCLSISITGHLAEGPMEGREHEYGLSILALSYHGLFGAEKARCRVCEDCFAMMCEVEFRLNTGGRGERRDGRSKRRRREKKGLLIVRSEERKR